MAFNGYFIKVGGYVLPMKYIAEKSYKAKVNTLDLDSETDATGYLNREVIQRIPIVTIKTIPLEQLEVDEIMNSFRANYEVDEERKASVEVWVPEYGDYVTQDMYLSDMDFDVDSVDLATNKVYYAPTTLKFNGYGEE